LLASTVIDELGGDFSEETAAKWLCWPLERRCASGLCKFFPKRNSFQLTSAGRALNKRRFGHGHTDTKPTGKNDAARAEENRDASSDRPVVTNRRERLLKKLVFGCGNASVRGMLLRQKQTG
jgi:hypothetical protein